MSELDAFFGAPRVVETERGQLDRQEARSYLLAGRAVVTFRNSETGNRFTFKVSAHESGSPWFVRILRGSEGDDFLGTIFDDGGFRHGRNSPISRDAPSARTFAWLWAHIDRLPETIEVWHEGRCLRCGRALTDPESIRAGYGPICLGRLR